MGQELIGKNRTNPNTIYKHFINFILVGHRQLITPNKTLSEPFHLDTLTVRDLCTFYVPKQVLAIV